MNAAPLILSAALGWYAHDCGSCAAAGGLQARVEHLGDEVQTLGFRLGACSPARVHARRSSSVEPLLLTVSSALLRLGV